MTDFTIKLRPKDVEEYQQMMEARDAEAAGWLKVRTALREYMSRYVNVDIDREVETLREIYLPDLVDEIAEAILTYGEDA
jgi:hypothetical protein